MEPRDLFQVILSLSGVFGRALHMRVFLFVFSLNENKVLTFRAFPVVCTLGVCTLYRSCSG